MKVLITSKSFGKCAPEAVELLGANDIEAVRGPKSSMTAEEIAAAVPGFDALIVGNDPVDRAVLDAGDTLKIVHMHGTGLDAIDVAGATERGILVANAPGANRNAVAELTVALMLAAARDLQRHMAVVRSGGWERRPGREVSGKTVGVLGLGNIGRRVVELLAGFGVDIHAYDPKPDAAWLRGRSIRLAASIDEVFPSADFLVLTLPLVQETKNIVNAARIATMKPEAYIINTARGGLVDEPALRAAVEEGRIAGAALDAFSEEPLPADSPLRVPGITLTPHLAATSVEAAGNVSMIVARNIVEVLVRGDPGCAVNASSIAAGRLRLRRR